MKKNDEYGNEVEAGDWIVYKGSYDLKAGVITSFTKGGSPRVLEYSESFRRREGNDNMPFYLRPHVVSRHFGFIKIQPMCQENPVR